jgi:hypothetical protein
MRRHFLNYIMLLVAVIFTKKQIWCEEIFLDLTNINNRTFPLINRI